MKNLFIYLLLITIFCSCEHDYCSIYVIKNNTSKNLRLHLKNEIIELNETYVLQNEKCSLGSISPLDLSEYDSIYLTDINNIILATFKPDTFEYENSSCTEKNIYNYYSCWLKKQKTSKYSYEYIFEITNEDIE